MNTRTTRILCLLLALLTMLSLTALLISCANDPNAGGSDTNIGAGGTSENVDEIYAAYNIPDSLPDRSFGDDEFVIACQDYDIMVHFFFKEEMEGGMIDSAVYRSVAAVEDRFDVNISTLNVESSTVIKNSINTQDGSFDFAFMHDTAAASFSLENLFTNLYTLEYLDFSQPWWPTPSLESLTYQDKMYLGSSTMSYLGLAQTFLVYFNKTIFDDNNLAYPYEDVFNGEWYMDDMIQLAEGFYDDVQGNSAKDADDTFGFLAPNGFYGWFESFGIEMVQKDGDDLILNAHCTEAYALVEYVYDIIVEKDMGFLESEPTVNDMFAQGQSAFIYGKLRAAYDVFRLQDINYGILPVPKLNEDQEQFHSAYTDRFFVVPSRSVSGKNTQDIGFILEALSAEGYRTIYPSYYEVAMQGRYSKDKESAKILTMLHPLRVIDFAYVYTSGKCFSRTLYDLIWTNQSGDYASHLSSGLDAALQKLDELKQQFSVLN